MTKAIKKLKNGKATGTDGIANELIKFGGPNVKRLVWFLLSKCFEKERTPKEWLKGILHPLYKSGDKRDPLNYRGIALLNCMSKLYETILQKRLEDWTEKYKVIKEKQGGFRRGRGCPDQIFVMESILKMNQQKKKNTYCCYIDMKKVYASI